MRPIIYICLILVAAIACKNETPTTTTKEAAIVEKTTTTPSAAKQTATKDCPIKGNILPENLKKLAKSKQILAIVADSTTHDSQFGESHRVLLIQDQATCTEVFRQALPVNQSPDFPYYIADINYNNTNALVAIKGYNTVYCYDINAKEILPVLTPQYVNAREAQDAQSRQIKHLELWEDYIIGYAADYGTFVFNILDNGTIKPTLPYAEYNVSGTDTFHSLFALQSNDAKTQLLFPDYDNANKQFSLNALLDKPAQFDINNSIVSKNNRYVIFQDIADKRPSVIDLKLQKVKELSAAQVAANPLQLIKALLAEEE